MGIQGLSGLGIWGFGNDHQEGFGVHGKGCEQLFRLALETVEGMLILREGSGTETCDGGVQRFVSWVFGNRFVGYDWCKEVTYE